MPHPYRYGTRSLIKYFLLASRQPKYACAQESFRHLGCSMGRLGLLPACLCVLTLTLAGCGANSPTPHPTPVGETQYSGSVHGGQQPVAGASIQLYTVGTTADGSAATPLLTSTVTSDATGSFTITGLYSC